MQNNLPNMGVNAIVQNFNTYQTQITQIVNSTNQASNSLKNAAAATQAHDASTSKLIGTFSKFIPQLGQVGELLGKAKESFSQGTEVTNQFAEALGPAGEAIGGLAIPIAAATAAFAAFFAVALRGAGFSDIQHGFEVITASAGQTADALLGKLQQATHGTVDDMKLMQVTNQALLGVNANLAKSFGQDLPGMMNIARAVALATGQDQIDVLNRIDEAVKRGNTRALTSIGIVVDQKAAFEEYAKAQDISVKNMTKAEQEQAVLNAVMKTGTGIANALGDATDSNATKLQQMQVEVGNTLDDLSKTLQPILTVILNAVNSVLKFIIGLVKGFITNMATGGAAVMGAFAGGLTWAANNLVYPVIIGIAKFIADFLMGLSPPPMGPLSTIDQGGANVMAAWVEGFTGVSLEPITQVADQVNEAMGNVANMSLVQVKARLEELDDAIRPFQAQLDLVKQHFTEIDDVAKPAMDIIDKRIALLNDALGKGSTAAAAQIKILDEQKTKLQDYVDTQQMAVDNAQIQLALAKMQQGTEREALLTQEQLLKQDTTGAGGKGAGAGKGKKPKGGGAGAVAPEDLPGLTLDPTQQNQVTNEWSQLGIDVNTAYQTAFTGAAGDTGAAIAAANETQVTGQINRINAGFANLGDKIDKGLVQPFRDKLKDVGNALGGLFDPGNPNSIQAFVGKLPGAFAAFGGSLYTNMVVPVDAMVSQALWFFNADNPDGLEQGITNFVTKTIPTAFTDLGTNLWNNLVTPFTERIKDVINNFDNFFNGKGSGTLPGVFDDVMTFFKGLPQKVSDALSGMVAAVETGILNPIIDAINSLIKGFEDFINTVVIPFVARIAAIVDILPGANQAIKSMTVSVSFPRIAHVGGAAEGGIFGAGALRVGERGSELITSASPISVFPNQFVNALDRLTDALIRPTASVANYSTVTNYNQQNVQLNGIPNAETAIMEFARLNAARAR